METTVYSIIPAGNKSLFWILGIVGFVIAVLAVVAIAMIMAWRGSQAARFELSPAGLTLRGDFYGREIPLAHLRGAAARVVDLRQAAELRPTSRRFGTGLPGYGAGWFRLANGERALLYLTRRAGVVYVPTTEGYSLLLSAERPEDMVARLRSLAPRS